MRAIRARVTGRVQGVFFRASTVREARLLGLQGWVRNRPDGSVEVWAQGPDPALDRLERFLARGPSGALVEAVASDLVEADPELAGFSVRA
jgi:acylphosphatase